MSILWVTIDKCKLHRPVNQYTLFLKAFSLFNSLPLSQILGVVGIWNTRSSNKL
jgi:hypothetical protein